ncbi:hypothetical protein BCR33DRAFT_491295 [Rhizoclosmatium globosum]|uniref:Uncharacterized protein n=1 Tax=Rhizoclosmatium globosum TaxID=329046 RepID=A0A1Y2BML1_9FUNG|nr:hypothetical protein BCR33DRAFT_491295 [Rhizoclosmatium globosum]|eukprot:ORY35988.1 hypothetical protein BCR33DRAFT_491295 [Rhizoclosmatium globosum]
MYAQQNEKLEEHERIDFKFLLGKQSTPELNFLAHSEQLLHPSDTLLTNRSESIQTGKILDWFHYSRSILFLHIQRLKTCTASDIVSLVKPTMTKPSIFPCFPKNFPNSTPLLHFIGYPVSETQLSTTNNHKPKETPWNVVFRER